MFCQATNMAQELRAEELIHASQQHIAGVTSLDRQRQTTNESICCDFRNYFPKIFTNEHGLSSSPRGTGSGWVWRVHNGGQNSAGAENSGDGQAYPNQWSSFRSVHIRPSEGGLEIPNVETQSMTLRLSFLGRMWAQHDENNFRKRQEGLSDPEKCTCERWGDLLIAEKQVLLPSAFSEGYLSVVNWFLWPPAVIKWDIISNSRGCTKDYLINELGVTKEEGCSLWLWAPGMRCLNNNAASLTWLVIQSGRRAVVQTSWRLHGTRGVGWLVGWFL